MRHLILALITVFTSTLFAQRKCATKPFHEKHNFTIEQKATLRIKKMALGLDLTEKQQNKILPLLKAEIQRHETLRSEIEQKQNSGVKPSDEEVFNKMNTALDHRLTYQKAIKNILSDEQFESWLKMEREHHKRKRHHMRDQRRNHHKNSPRNDA